MSDVQRYKDAWADLQIRLENAAAVMSEMAQKKDELGHDSDVDRLRGKVTGIGLALSYMRDYDL